MDTSIFVMLVWVDLGPDPYIMERRYAKMGNCLWDRPYVQQDYEDAGHSYVVTGCQEFFTAPYVVVRPQARPDMD
jgi:hypothetical protein